MHVLVRGILIAVALVAAAAGLTGAMLWLSGYGGASSCAGLIPADCLELRALDQDRVVLIATVIGISLSAIGTFALVITIFLTAKATEAAVGASRAANQAVELAREATVRELRPYMAFDHYSLTYSTNERQEVLDWCVRLRWLNTGSTMAHNVRAKASFVIVPGDLPEDFDFPERAGDESVGTVGKERSFASPAGAMSLADVQDVLDRRKRLFVWGWVEYRGFEAARIYRTEWHSEIILWDGPATNPGIGHDNSLRKLFNGADEHCSRPTEG